jgi:serine/threonine protein kinase
MGEIFLARGRTPSGGSGLAAVKRLLPQAAQDPAFVKMFLDEGRLVRRLRHPNVCSTWDHGRTADGQYYLAMEWIDGVSVQRLLRRAQSRAAIPLHIATRIIADVASALDYAHRLSDESGDHLGIVHRDVSPANIMVDLDGRVKLVDFGLAKARTQPGFVKGKFGYLSPEQLTGRVDYRTDVFALGLCLWELLTTNQLFEHSTAAETIAAIKAYEGPPDIRDARPDVTPEIGEILTRSLARLPSERFSSAGEMKLYLERALRKMRRPTVDARELAAFVRDLFPERAPVAVVAAPSQFEDDDELEDLNAGKRSLPLVLAGGAALLAIGLLVYFLAL